MNTEKRFGALSSSTDPQALGTTVKGGILAVSTIVVMVAKAFDLPLTETDMVTLATQLGAAVSALTISFGIVQKVFVAGYNKWFKN